MRVWIACLLFVGLAQFSALAAGADDGDGWSNEAVQKAADEKTFRILGTPPLKGDQAPPPSTPVTELSDAGIVIDQDLPTQAGSATVAVRPGVLRGRRCQLTLTSRAGPGQVVRASDRLYRVGCVEAGQADGVAYVHFSLKDGDIMSGLTCYSQPGAPAMSVREIGDELGAAATLVAYRVSSFSDALTSCRRAPPIRVPAHAPRVVPGGAPEIRIPGPPSNSEPVLLPPLLPPSTNPAPGASAGPRD